MLKRPLTKNGYVAIVVIVFFAIILSLSAVLLQYVSTSVKSARTTVSSAQALQLADAGLDIAVSKLNAGSYSGETNTAVGEGTVTISVATINSQTKSITSTGTATYKGKTVSKTVRANVGINSTVISFRYGVQAGAGGFSLTGGSTINGNVYSNGNISATTGVHITGSAVAADPPALVADQTNDTPSTISSCSSSNCITFGNASGTQDFSQSFKISTATPLNNIAFYLKKVSTPGNLTVRIVTDNAGSPSNTQLMSGTISAASVTTNFGWVSATFPTTPVLDPSQTYWMVLDGSSNSSKYYVIGANSDGYANGQGKLGSYGGSWANTSPSGLDGYFQIYLGGGNSMIGGNSYNTGVYIGTTTSDETWAYNVMGATMTGPLYCQTSSYTSKSCNTSRSSPPPASMPLSDNNIQDWKDDAEAGGTTTGDVNVGYAGATLGPKKITGNVTVGGGGTLTVTGTLWIQGNLTISGGGKVKLASSYGSNSGVLVVDGVVSLTGGSDFAGSGTAGSYPFVITTSACPVAPGCNGNNAIYLSGGSGTVALIAQNGTVQISGGANLKAVTAKQIAMDGGATLNYDSGLVSESFYSGPGGSWEFVSGSYAITN